MSFVFSGLQDIENFFSTAGADLVTYTHFLATDVVNLVHAIDIGVKDIVSFFQQVVNDLGIAGLNTLQTFVNVFNTMYNVLETAWSSMVTNITSAMQTIINDLYNISKAFVSWLIGFAQNIVNDIVSITENAIEPVLIEGLKLFGEAAIAAEPVVQKFLPLISPIMYLKVIPTFVDNIENLIGDITISLEFLGLGGQYEVKLGEILSKIGAPVAELLKELGEELYAIYKDAIKEPFISSFRVTLRQLWNNIGLGDLPFRDPTFVEVARFLTSRKFDEIKDHLNETLLLTGYPQWFTDTYYNSPKDSYVPGNPFYHPLPLGIAVPAVQLGLMEYNQMLDLAWYNLSTPSIAGLQYKVETARIVERAVLQGLRYFVIKPHEGYQILHAGMQLSGQELYNFIFSYEYQFGLQRTVKQFLRSLLSRALTDFGRPYLEPNVLYGTINKLFTELGYPSAIEDVFRTMIGESQQVQANQLIYEFIVDLAKLGVFDEKYVDELIRKHSMNRDIIVLQVQNYAYLAMVHKAVNIIESMMSHGLIDVKYAVSLLKPYGFSKQFIDVVENLYTINLNAGLWLRYIETLTSAGVLSEQDAVKVAKAYNLNENYVSVLYNVLHRILLSKTEEEGIKTLSTLGVKITHTILVKDYAELLEQVHLQKSIVENTINYVKALLSTGMLTASDAEKMLKDLHLEPSIINLIVNMETGRLTARAEEEAVKTLLSLGVEYKSSKLNKAYFDILQETYVQKAVIEHTVNYVKELLRHGLLSPTEAEKQLSNLHLNPEISKLIIDSAYRVFYAETVIRYVEAQLRKFLISKTQAEELLLKVGMPKDLADMYIAIHTPNVVEMRSIAEIILEGDIYNVGRVPVKVPTNLATLERLGIEKSQAQILADAITARVGLELWKSHLPKLQTILEAITYGFDYKKLLEYSMIPSELFDLHANLQSWINIAKIAHELVPLYVKLLQYSSAQAGQLESVLIKYGITAEQLALYKLRSTIEKFITMYQELYLTPSKVISLAEYLSNWRDLLQKSFVEYNVPPELQSVYLEATRNRRLLRYVNAVIETMYLLAERQQIDVPTAQQLLTQLKQYGLTDEEIQLITLNIQLRLLYK